MSATTPKYTCDGCGEDLTVTDAMPAYRLALTAQQLPSNSSYRYAVCVDPPIDSAKHFCGTACILKWLSPPTAGAEHE